MSLNRTIFRAPAALRPLLFQQPQRSLYHSYEHNAPAPYPATETTILSAALAHVPVHGFTQEALSLGAKESGYLDISTNLFRKGAFDLIIYYLVTQRLALGGRVQFLDENMGVGRRVRALVMERLRANAEAGVVQHWQGALGHMSLAENIPASLKELAKLSDEIWFQAGDISVDSSWYTKRASLSSVYAATEMYQTQDQSTDFKDTEAFLDRRLDEVRTVGGAVGGTFQWAGFQAGAMVNLLRSKGMRI
jgi:ubiquinone biosynthesis protein COQ9